MASFFTLLSLLAAATANPVSIEGVPPDGGGAWTSAEDSNEALLPSLLPNLLPSLPVSQDPITVAPHLALQQMGPAIPTSGEDDPEAAALESYEDDLDLDSEEDSGDADKTAEGEEVAEGRVKRKVIFGGGGGYSSVGRGRGRGGDGDPYGRRRDSTNYHGPDYTQYGGGGSQWNYGMDYGYVDYGTTSETAPSPRPTRSHTYGTVHTSPDDPGSPSVPAATKKERTGRREVKKLSRDTKEEMARYALEHGVQEALDHYSRTFSRKLNRKKIDKFIRRYQRKQERKKGRQE